MVSGSGSAAHEGSMEIGERSAAGQFSPALGDGHRSGRSYPRTTPLSSTENRPLPAPLNVPASIHSISAAVSVAWGRPKADRALRRRACPKPVCNALRNSPRPPCRGWHIPPPPEPCSSSMSAGRRRGSVRSAPHPAARRRRHPASPASEWSADPRRRCSSRSWRMSASVKVQCVIGGVNARRHAVAAGGRRAVGGQQVSEAKRTSEQAGAHAPPPLAHRGA